VILGAVVNETHTDNTAPYRHATWMELFFDLVAVAGIGQLTHLLHRGPSLGDLALYLVLYLAFWMAWACITLYSNIARDHTRPPLMLSAMLGLGIMAAAVAGIPERHAIAFAAVYVVLRIGTSQVWGRGRIVVDWPVAQLSGGVLPWVISL
jgi:low temperature requirement protein LtrA